MKLKTRSSLHGLLTVLILSALLSSGLRASDSLPLVRAARPVASIVVDPNADQRVKAAALALQRYILQSTGTGAKLSCLDAPGEGVMIHVGRTAAASAAWPDVSKLDRDGFVLQGIDEKNFVILGGGDAGTEYGVYDFLERYLGVRWLMPTALGEDVPPHRDLNVPIAKVSSEPVFLLRCLSPLYSDGPVAGNPFPRYPEWSRLNRLNTPEGRIEFHHHMRDLFPASLFTKSHPEFYPQVDLKAPPREFATLMTELHAHLVHGRYLPSDDKDRRWQPNFSAPGLVDAAADRIIEYFQKNPQATSYSLGINDTGNYDQSAASLARRSGGTNYLGLEDTADDFYAWADAVVEKVLKVFPDKWFGTLAYSQLAEPPRKVTVHPRLVPFLTFERLLWLDPELREASQKVNEKWAGVAQTIGWWDYIYGSQYLVPRVYPYQMQNYLSWGAAHRVRYVFAELYPNWGEGPKPWLYAKLLWNPNLDVKSALDDWYNHAVGAEAAPKLAAYYALWEKFWTEEAQKSAWWNRSGDFNKFQRQYLSFNDLDYLRIVPKTTITESDQLMEGVRRLAGTPAQKQRAGQLYRMWQFYKLSWYSYQGECLAKDLNGTDATRVLEALGEAEFYLDCTGQRQELFKSFKDDPLFGDIYQRHYVNAWPRRGENWVVGLITKASGLAKSNGNIRAKLEALSRSKSPLVSETAKSILF